MSKFPYGWHKTKDTGTELFYDNGHIYLEATKHGMYPEMWYLLIITNYGAPHDRDTEDEIGPFTSRNDVWGKMREIIINNIAKVREEDLYYKDQYKEYKKDKKAGLVD